MSEEYRLRVETEAVKALRAGLQTVGLDPADEQLVVDTIEGETNFVEAVDGVLARMDAAEALAVGLTLVEERYAVRRRALEARVERLRTMLEQAMTIAEVQKLERPTATVFFSSRRPELVVDDESRIPTRFYRAGAPKLDKTELRQALLAGEVDGAHLSQGGVTLTIKRK